MQIKIGAPVEAKDGRAGKVERLVFNPHTREVTEIVVVQGWLLPHDVVVPIDRVQSATEAEVRVNATVEEIRQMPPFSLAQYTEPPPEWLPPMAPGESILDLASTTYLFPTSPYAVGAFTPGTQPEPSEEPVETLPRGSVDIGADSPVYCRDGLAGHVHELVTDGDGDRVTQLVVCTGTLLAHDRTVPIERVERVDSRGVHLGMTVEELRALPLRH